MMKLVAGECKVICFIEFSIQIYTFQVFYYFEGLLCLDFETTNKSMRTNTAVFGTMKTSKYHCKLASGWWSHRNQF